MPFELPNPDAGNNSIDMQRSDYWKALLGAGGLFAVIGLYALEIVHFHNTLQVRQLVIMSLGFGLALGLLVATRLHKYGKTPIEIFQIYIIVTLLTMAVMPLAMSMSNRLLSFQDMELEYVEFVQTNAFVASRFGRIPGQKPEGYHTFIIYRNQVERIKTKEVLFPDAEKGELVELPVKKGLWGFRYFIFEGVGDMSL